MISRSMWCAGGLVLLACTVIDIGCGVSDSEPPLGPSQVRVRFPDHAALVLEQSERFAAVPGGFALQIEPHRGTWRSVDVLVPARASDAIILRTRGGAEIQVREIGATGAAALEENAVAYQRSGGRSYWTSTDSAVEEWIHFAAGSAFGDRVAASWTIDGASPREAGDEIELVNAEGVVQMRVAAPAAYAEGGRDVPVRLAVHDHTIDLYVDANGAEVLVDPSWTSAGTMVVGRMMHAAAVLSSGKVIVAGGTNDVFNLPALSSSEIYNPVTNTWSSGPAYTGVFGQTMTTLQSGKVLSVGGAGNGGFAFGTVQIYDPIANTWSPAASTPTAFSRHTATLLPDGTVLVTGGSLGFGGSAVRTVYSFNPVTGTWTQKANMIGLRYTHTATLLTNGKVLVAGGTTSGAGLRTAELYDPSLNTWTAMPQMATGRYMHTATRLSNGKVLMASGATSAFGSDTATCTIFDPATNTWSVTGPVAQLRDTHADMLLSSGKVLIAGGENGATGNGYATSEIYDPAVGTWSAGPVMLAAHAYTAGAGTQGGLLVAGGGTDIFTLNQVAEIFPDSSLGGNGAPCASGNACASGFCADGVCCNTACAAGACDACSVAAGAAADGTCAPLTGPVCNDGNACTQGDTCQSGVCTGGSPVSCVAQDQCHSAGTCDPNTGACSNPALVDGTPCNDGDACTTRDDCRAGVCTGGIHATCSASDQCHLAGTCDPQTGQCSSPTVQDGTTCDDGDACTQSDTCEAGACTGASPVVCGAADQCHDAGSCDPMTGMCSSPVKPDGTACDDGNSGTKSDACHAGVCAGITCLNLTRGSSIVEDAYIHSGFPAQNNGAATELSIGPSSQSLLRFDLSPIPPGVTLVSASLQVRTTQAGGTVNVHQILAPWTEATVTYASFGGAFAPAILGSYTATLGFHSVDVLGIVQSWLGGFTPNDGLLLESSAFSAIFSSEAAGSRPLVRACYLP